jgi:hypothetical protein
MDEGRGLAPHDKTCVKSGCSSEVEHIFGAPLAKFRLVYADKAETKSLKAGKKQKKGKRGGRQVLPGETSRIVRSPVLPFNYNASPTYTCHRRFRTSDTIQVVNQQFTIANGHDQFLNVINVAGLANCWVDMWRIKKIYVWCVATFSHSTLVFILPAGADIDSNSFNDREQVFTCQARSEAFPGHMCVEPSTSSPLGSWHETTTVNAAGPLFTINIGNTGAASTQYDTTTMDIEFEYVVNMTGVANGYTVATTTTSLGTLGVRNISTGLLAYGVNVLG